MSLKQNLYEYFHEHPAITILLFLILFVQSFSFQLNPDIWWDAAVYIEMGKYLYSGGTAGLWEPERPLVWPLVLGFFWKLGLDEIFWGKISIFLLGAGAILVTYHIAEEIFDKKTAFLSAMFLAFWPVFFQYMGVLQTEIPATFFFLLGLFFLLKKKYPAAGFVFGMTVMTRFFQIFLLLPIVLFCIYQVFTKREKWSNFFLGVVAFALPVFAYLIMNFLLYKNPFYPLLLQGYMTQYTGWIFHHSWQFYFKELFRENILSFVAVISIFLLWVERKKEKEGEKKLFIAAIFVLGFLPFLFAVHKEMRLLLPLLPFLSMLIAWGCMYFLLVLKSQKQRCVLGIVLFLLWAGATFPQLRFNTYDDHLDMFYEEMQKAAETEGIWVSNPAFLMNTNKKAEGLIYFPLYNTEKIQLLEKRLENARLILINSCDLLPCPPNDSFCEKEHEQFMQQLDVTFRIVRKEMKEGCLYSIYSKI